MADPAAIRILIVDDDTVMLALLKHMLANLRFNDVAVFSSGIEALEWLDAPVHGVDLILLDLNMPEMDGVEFLRKLVDRRYAGSLILVSGEDEQVLQTAETLVRAHRITALGHVKKPVQPGALAAIIEKWAPIENRGLRGTVKTYPADQVRRAIENRELINVYQPKVAVATGKVVGVETLVRWRHPTDGMVYPDQFIGIAEEHLLIDSLTQVVIGNALAQARQWLDAGLVLHVAVNVSMGNLTSLKFPDMLSEQTAKAGVAAPELVLEITESRLMPKIVAVLDVLTRLRLKRFRLSIDDFGTGHSSLAQLRDIPFDELKVDRGFVHGASHNEKKRAICDASLGLARQLGISVVAEGVEDREDWNFLRKGGCDFAQGYYIAKPMPGHELLAWMPRWDERVRAGI